MVDLAAGQVRMHDARPDRMKLPWRQDRWLPRGYSMPDKYGPLAISNAERSRGVVHTPNHQARMRELQADYDRWYAEWKRK
jgi:hypothetical protein